MQEEDLYMPSKTEPQARLMAGIAHGWHPSGLKHAPSQAVATEFNQADKGSALLSHAMQHHAAGGAISPLASLVGNPMTMRSSLPRMGQPIGSAGRLRMPHVPLADTMHNIDQHMSGARLKLPKLRAGGRAQCFDDGGVVNPPASQPAQPTQQPMSDDVINALLRAAQIKVATDPEGVKQDHGNLRALIAYMAQRKQLGPQAAGPPPQFDEGGRVSGQSSPGSPGFGGAVKDALAALKDYMIDRPRREIQAAREARENAIIGDSPPAQQGEYAAGGQVPMGEQARGAVKKALTHLANKDASSAAATLHASPEAMQHPVVRLAAHALRTSQGMAPAVRGLAGVAGQGSAQAQ
jgi:hypothetical protein